MGGDSDKEAARWAIFFGMEGSIGSIHGCRISETNGSVSHTRRYARIEEC